MFNLFSALVTVCAIKDIIKEKLERPAPSGTRFDWDAYHDDVMNPDVSTEEIIRKQKYFCYQTTQPEKKTTFNYKLYNKNKELFPDIAERLKEIGYYGEE